MIDLFEYVVKQPNEIFELNEAYWMKFNKGDLTLSDCESWKTEAEDLGYTFDYALNAEPYNLRKI